MTNRAKEAVGKLLSYGSVVLDKNDVTLLKEGRWLNDRLITFASDYLVDQLSPEQKEVIEVVCCSTCELIKFDGEFNSWLENYANKKLVLFIVNNNKDPTRPGGSHWSLLVFEGEQRSFIYLDSLHSPDPETAELIMRNASAFLCPGSEPRLATAACPKQHNSNDCGIFVIEYIKFILENAQLPPSELFSALCAAKMDESFIKERRNAWSSLITELSNKNKAL